MKGRILLLAPEGAALLVGGRVEDAVLAAGPGDGAPQPGDVWRARVERMARPLGGAFLSLGAGGMGFLRETEGVAEGQILLVQVVAIAERGKAVPVSRRILYKSRALIHTPGAPGVNVSRQIADGAERARLLAALPAPAEGGFILRTAAEGLPTPDLVAEAAAMLSLRAEAEAGGGEPGIRLRRAPADLALAEWTHPLPDALIVGGQRRLPALPAALAGVARAEMGDVFDRFGVWEALDAARVAEVPLPSGATMAVEPTRAFVAVDVNTAGTIGAGAALTATLEAARELPRQLRLRGLGGIVVVDCAPVRKADRRRVEDAFRTSLSRDPIETTIAGWTPLGALELQRKRERRPLAELAGPAAAAGAGR